MKTCPLLEILNLSFNKIKSLLFIENQYNLIELNISNNLISLISGLKPIKELKKLNNINITGNEVELVVDCNKYLKSNLPKLKIINNEKVKRESSNYGDFNTSSLFISSLPNSTSNNNTPFKLNYSKISSSHDNQSPKTINSSSNRLLKSSSKSPNKSTIKSPKKQNKPPNRSTIKLSSKSPNKSPNRSTIKPPKHPQNELNKTINSMFNELNKIDYNSLNLSTEELEKSIKLKKELLSKINTHINKIKNVKSSKLPIN